MRDADLGLAERAHESGQAVGISALCCCGGAPFLARGSREERRRLRMLQSFDMDEGFVVLHVMGKRRRDRGRDEEIARDHRVPGESGRGLDGFLCNYPLPVPSPSPSPRPMDISADCSPAAGS
jgi:hypothetical protein